MAPLRKSRRKPTRPQHRRDRLWIISWSWSHKRQGKANEGLRCEICWFKCSEWSGVKAARWSGVKSWQAR